MSDPKLQLEFNIVYDVWPQVEFDIIDIVWPPTLAWDKIDTPWEIVLQLKFDIFCYFWPQVGVLLQHKFTFLWKNDPRIWFYYSSSDPTLGLCYNLNL